MVRPGMGVTPSSFRVADRVTPRVFAIRLGPVYWITASSNVTVNGVAALLPRNGLAAGGLNVAVSGTVPAAWLGTRVQAAFPAPSVRPEPIWVPMVKLTLWRSGWVSGEVEAIYS